MQKKDFSMKKGNFAYNHKKNYYKYTVFYFQKSNKMHKNKFTTKSFKISLLVTN